MKKPTSRREIAAWHAFAAPAYGRDAPEIPKARAPSRDLEHKEQCAVIDWWRSAHNGFGLPEFALFAVPNGGSRHMLTAVRLKAEGVRSGIPDLFLAVPAMHKGYWKHGFFIEMKSAVGVPSDPQRRFFMHADNYDYENAFCYSADEAIGYIKSYLGGP